METVIIKYVADTEGLKPAVDALLLMGKITDEDAKKIAVINAEQKEFLSTLNKTTTEAGKLTTEMEDLKKVIQNEVMAGMAEGIADWAAESKNAVKGFKSIKAELKELKAQIASGSLGEKELRAATKRAGELADAIADANQQVKAFEGNRFERVLTRASEGARALSAGMAAAAGAQALFGSENEDFNKTLVKVQGSMALLQGTQELTMLLQKESALMIGLNEVKTYAFATAQRVAGAASAAFGVQVAASTAVATAGLSVLLAGLAYLIVTMDDVRENATDMDKALAGDAQARKDGVKMRLDMMRDGIDKEKAQRRIQFMEEKNDLDKQFRNKEISKLAWNAKNAALTDKYFFDLQAISDKYDKEEADKTKAQRERIAKIRQDANNKALQEQLRQIRDEIANNEILMRETNDINAKIKYYAEITRLRKAQIQIDNNLTVNEKILEQARLDDELRNFEEHLTKRTDADVEAFEEANDAKLEANLDWWEKYFATEDEFNARLLAKRKENSKMWSQFVIDQANVVANAAFQINANLRQGETNNLLESLNTQRDAELANKELTDAQRLQIEARYQQQEAQIKQRAWEAQKAADIAQAIINTALAVSRALTIGPPQNIPASIAAGVAGAAQIAVIQSIQAPKFEDGGLVGGKLHKQGGTLIEAEKGEFVINRQATAEYFPVINALNNHQVDPTLANNIVTQLAAGLMPQANGGYEIDYNKLAQIVERGKSTVSINMDEQGFSKYMARKGGTVSFRNSKLRIKQ